MGPYQQTPWKVSYDRVIRYSGFFGVRETEVLLEISWTVGSWLFSSWREVWKVFKSKITCLMLKKVLYLTSIHEPKLIRYLYSSSFSFPAESDFSFRWVIWVDLGVHSEKWIQHRQKSSGEPNLCSTTTCFIFCCRIQRVLSIWTTRKCIYVYIIHLSWTKDGYRKGRLICTHGWYSNHPFSGATADGSEILFPTTWDVVETL